MTQERSLFFFKPVVKAVAIACTGSLEFHLGVWATHFVRVDFNLVDVVVKAPVFALNAR